MDVVEKSMYLEKGMTPQVQLSTNCELGCFVKIKIFFSGQTANLTFGWQLHIGYNTLPLKIYFFATLHPFIWIFDPFFLELNWSWQNINVYSPWMYFHCSPTPKLPWNLKTLKPFSGTTSSQKNYLSRIIAERSRASVFWNLFCGGGPEFESCPGTFFSE